MNEHLNFLAGPRPLKITSDAKKIARGMSQIDFELFFSDWDFNSRDKTTFARDFGIQIQSK